MKKGFLQELNLLDASLLVVGCIIGAGIFRTPATISTSVHEPFLILLIWLFGGLFSLCGALCYAELASSFPKTGGDYIYLGEAYGRLTGFLFGWTKLFIERTGTIAILAFVFAEYLRFIFHYGEETLKGIASLAILLLTVANIIGVRFGKYVQNCFTLLKVGAILGIILFGILRAPVVPSSWHPFFPETFSLETIQSLGVALIFVLWTYGGWTEASYVAEEVKDPERNLPRAIVFGVLLTMGLYLLVNGVYLYYIPIGEMASDKLVAATAVQKMVGGFGGNLVSLMVAFSAFGALNGYILTGARILYALGEDHPLFGRLAKLHPDFHTPNIALWFNAAIAILLILTKSFEEILTYTTVAISVFFGMAGYSVILLRKKYPDRKRRYKVWGYPVIPLLFILTTLLFILNACLTEPKQSLFGLAIVALGFPLYAISSRMAK
ncbi:MAG: amino acid permease [Candidatus Omnitrophica bacterium]|nr:amino acid permease [Candidatus Omnitrophota bacterium]